MRALGAHVVEMPAIEIQPLPWKCDDPGIYDWIVFTSANGVHGFLERLPDIRAVRGRICAIGPATRAAIEALHLPIDLIGQEYVAESLLAALEPHRLTGSRILVARAAVARDVLPEGLRARGAHVDVLEVYRSAAPAGLAEVDLERVDWVTFTSSSTVDNLVRAVGLEKLRGIRTASIGPITSATLRKHGLNVDAEAVEFTVDGLVNAILNHTPKMG
jgi:uroporphyrinogen III methyltransferase/synthase